MSFSDDFIFDRYRSISNTKGIVALTRNSFRALSPEDQILKAVINKEAVIPVKTNLLMKVGFSNSSSPTVNWVYLPRGTRKEDAIVFGIIDSPMPPPDARLIFSDGTSSLENFIPVYADGRGIVQNKIPVSVYNLVCSMMEYLYSDLYGVTDPVKVVSKLVKKSGFSGISA